MKAEVATLTRLKCAHTLLQPPHSTHPGILTSKVGWGFVEIASGCGHGTCVLDLVLSFLLRDIRSLNEGSLVVKLGVLEQTDKTGVVVVGKYLQKPSRTSINLLDNIKISGFIFIWRRIRDYITTQPLISCKLCFSEQILTLFSLSLTFH